MIMDAVLAFSQFAVTSAPCGISNRGNKRLIEIFINILESNQSKFTLAANDMRPN
jgi:hypothetical protein